MTNTVENLLRSLLAKNIVRFTYQKVNGEIRHAIGTRNLDLARAKTGADIPAPRFGEQPNSYYDLDKMGWRSYKPELLISIDGVEPLKTPVKREIPVEMPSHTDNLPMSEILKGLFGDVSFGVGVPKEEIRKAMDELDEDIEIVPPKGGRVSKPYFNERGLVADAEINVDDFARLIARYVVAELVKLITK